VSLPPQLPLDEAVARYTADGDAVYIGNFGTQLYAVGHELIRQRRRHLHAVMPSGGLLLDQLLGAGCVDAATFGHCWSSIGPRPAWNFRRYYEQEPHEVRWHELSLGAMNAALTAGAWRVPFMPIPGLPGTAYLTEDLAAGRLETVSSAFGSATVVQALRPDVAFVYADRADRWGNAVVAGPHGDTLIAAQAADRVIVVAEELVSDDELRGSQANLPGVVVSSVVVAPDAVRPDGAEGRYPRDIAAIDEYVRRSATREGFEQWLDAEVLT
jgi:glutaconate CoA-transferase, subunit A